MSRSLHQEVHATCREGTLLGSLMPGSQVHAQLQPVSCELRAYQSQHHVVVQSTLPRYRAPLSALSRSDVQDQVSPGHAGSSTAWL